MRLGIAERSAARSPGRRSRWMRSITDLTSGTWPDRMSRAPFW